MTYIIEYIIKFHIYEIKSKAGKIIQKNYIHFNIIQSYSCKYNIFFSIMLVSSQKHLFEQKFC